MSNIVPDHLNARALACLELTDAERIEKIKSPRWISYPRAREIHTKLDDLFHYPKVARMPSVLVCGPSNAGKTVLVQRFVDQKNRMDTEEPTLPILMVQAPADPDVRDFFSLCLLRLCAPHRASDRAERLRAQLSVILKNLHTKMLVIDEVHHLIAGSAIKQRVFLNTIKFLSNDLQIPIVAIGNRDALNAFQIDPQIGNRFEPVAVPRWHECEEYTKLLASFEVSTPLRLPSDLADNRLARRLVTMSEGLIGELAELLRRAAELAIRTGRERIDADLLGSMNWVLPSQRRAAANFAFD